MSRPMGRLVAAVLLARCVATANANTAGANPYVVPEDQEVAAEAAAAVNQFCTGLPELSSEQEDSARDALVDAVGGENMFLDALTESDDPDEFGEALAQSILSPGWILPRTSALIGAVLVLVVSSICCWSTCPCCRCCRCCTKERQPLLIPKVVVLVILTACFGSIMFGLSQTLAGYAAARDGFGEMACASAQVLNATLFGHDDPFFVGMVPALDTVWNLDQQLEDNSPLLTEAFAVLDSTAPIQDAVALAAATLRLMGDTLQLPANVQPTSSSGRDLLHTCRLCETIAGEVGDISTALEGGVGAALAQARAEVQRQISPEDRADLQATLRGAAQPLVDFKDAVRGSFAAFISADSFGQIESHVQTTVYYILNAFCVFATLFLACACFSSGCWAAREKTEGSYSRVPHRCALLTIWCSVPFFIVPVLIVGGVLRVVTLPLAGLCLTLEEMDGPTLLDIAPALGMPFAGDEAVMMSGLVDACIAGTGDPNPNLMDIVFTRDPDTGEEVYARGQLQGTVRDPLDAAFAGIQTALGGAGGSFADAPAIQGFLSVLRDTPVDAMLLPDAGRVQGDSAVAPMLQSEPLRVGLATSASCDNFTASTGDVIPGIGNFVDRLAELGPRVPGASCAQTVVCTPPGDAACAAGNAYVELKRTLLQPAPRLFRCDVFETAGGAACDPKDMAEDGSGGWTSECLIRQGSAVTTRVKEVTCNLEEFKAYVQNYEERLLKVFGRLDDATAQTTGQIVDDLQRIVTTYILDPVWHIVSGITCGFMPGVFHGFLSGFCYQGVVGFRTLGAAYVTFAVSVLVVALVMYFEWRLAVDNVNAECDQKAAQGAAEGQETSV